jgi:uncharacterized membrane protein (UPF0127 family)
MNISFNWPTMLPSEPPAIIAQMQLDHAHTAAELSRGLMGRKSIPSGYGMLFHLTPNSFPTFWSKGCYCSLDVAFIDSSRCIRQIGHLKAFPEIVDSQKFLQNPNDFDSLFQKEAITAKVPTTYVLECREGWFKENNISIGTSLSWEGREAFFTHCVTY